MSLYAGEGRVFTGDMLLIGGTGRADFAGGDAGAQYDAITGKLFALPDETIVYPAHDYRGNTCSTIGDEKRSNPRVAGRTREAVHRRSWRTSASRCRRRSRKCCSRTSPRSTTIESEIPVARRAEPGAPDDGGRGEAARLAATAAAPSRRARAGGIRRASSVTFPAAVLVPLKDLPARVAELERAKHGHVIVICRAGVRSTTAAAILTGLGFEHVSNLQGGMVDWNDQGLPVER